MHALQEIALGIFSAEEARKDSAFHPECLVPARRAFANRVLQMRPHWIKRIVGIMNVAGQRIRAVGSQIFVGLGRVHVNSIALFKQPERDAGVEQSWQRFVIRWARAVEDAELHRRKHRFRSSKGVDQVKNVVGCGHSLSAELGGLENAPPPVFPSQFGRSVCPGLSRAAVRCRAARNPRHRATPVRELRL